MLIPLMSTLPVTLPASTPHGILIAVYIFAILTLVLHGVDTVIQYQWMQQRSKKYLATRVPFLVVVLLGVLVCIRCVEVNRSERGTRWVPAIWVLLDFSILLGKSLQAITLLRLCNNLRKDNRSQKLAYIQLLSVISTVLILDILAFVFVFVQSQSGTTVIPVILLVLGSCFAHAFASYFPLWLLGRAKLLPNPREREWRERNIFGLLGCSFSSFLAVGASLGLLGFSELFTKFLVQLIVVFVSAIPWVVLQGYKLKDRSAADKTDALVASSNGSSGDSTGPGEEYELQTDVNGKVFKCMALDLSGSGIPGQHAAALSNADPEYQEITSPPAIYDVDSDQDSAIGVDRRDSTTTMSLEASNTVEKHGRGYHGYRVGKYLLPNDEQERNRLDLQHNLFCITLDGSLHLVRLPTTHRVLDIGTGTGIWSIDFDKYPDAEVYGVDLSPMQPEWTPPNCIFQIDDLSLSWNFEYPFDFIHGRMLFCSFSDPLHVFREAFKALTAGGVLEMQDVIFDFRSFDDSLKGSALEEWAKKLQEAFKSKGIDLACVSKYRNYLETVGFENIKQTDFHWPVGMWPKMPKYKILGKWCQANILKMLFAISIVPLTEHRPHSMSVEAVQVLLARVREDLHNPDIHAYLQVLVIHGRKPKPNIFLHLENQV